MPLVQLTFDCELMLSKCHTALDIHAFAGMQEELPFLKLAPLLLSFW